MTISDIIPDGAILDGMIAATSDELFRLLVQSLVSAGSVPKGSPAELLKQLHSRYELGCIEAASGIAVVEPGRNLPAVPQLAIAIGRSRSGLPLEGDNGASPHVVFLFTRYDLPALARLGTMLRTNSELVASLKNAPDGDAMRTAMLRADEEFDSEGTE